MEGFHFGLMLFLWTCSLSIIRSPLANAQGSIADNYIGCYKFANSATVTSNDNLSIESCITQCRQNNATYAAVQGGKNCSCLDILDTSYQSNECSSSCSGNQSEFCGGQNRIYSIYTVCPVGLFGFNCDIACHCEQLIPCDRKRGKCPNDRCDGNWTGATCNNVSISGNYLGCHDDDPRVLSLSVPGDGTKYTSKSCSLYCSGQNYTYFGLEWYDQCFCGNSYGNSKPGSESNCDKRCYGNPNEFCGGYYRLSLYSVCPAGNYGNQCYAKCNCANNGRCSYSSGVCPSGGCKSGWTGSSCSIRDCGRNNGDCLSNQTCVTLNLKYASVSRCMCSSGYQRNSLTDYCTDMDECSLDEPVCNTSNSICNNTIGSYRCDCKQGYQSMNSTICIDIDECTSRTDMCNKTISRCINTDGGYRCYCESGYKNDDAKHCSDINECSLDGPVCNTSNSICSNTIGSYRCNCKQGYASVNSTLCADVNECLVGNNLCDNTTTNCSNTDGGYRCVCTDGFKPKTDFSCSKKVEGGSDEAGKIAGAVVGSILGLVFIIGIVLLLIYICRRNRDSDKKLKEAPYTVIDDVQTDDSIRHRNVKSLYVENAEKRAPKISAKSALETVRNKLADPNSIQEEFQSVPLKINEFSVLGAREEMKKKNRFLNIIPYDSNRVILSRITDDDASEYINASYVQGYNETDKFIAAQGPRDESVNDFWRMIVEKDITLIVMMTNLMEHQKKKCVQYWPVLGNTKTFGSVSVTLVEEDVWPSYTVRRLKASTKSKNMEIAHWHYMAWPDHGVPNDIKCFLGFHRKIRQRMSPEMLTLVHCSAGVGRTGAFIATDYLLEQEKTEHNVDVLQCLKKLRDDRPSMIQTLAQYEFVHRALVKAFTIGNTAIPIKSFSSQYQSWQKIDSKAGKTSLEIQFQDIEETKSDSEETGKYRIWTNAVEQSIIDEMEAVFIHSWKRKDAFIWTKLLDDHENIWTLRKDQGSEIIIYIESAEDSDVRFLPSKEKSIVLKNSTLLMESETKEKYGACCLITESTEVPENSYENSAPEAIYQNAEIGSNKSQITVLRLKEPNGGKWTNVDSLRALFNFIESYRTQKSHSDFPVMVTSRSSSSFAGFLIAMLNAIEMMKLEEEIDLYQIVLNIRKSKRDLFSSLSSYVDLHDVVDRYIRTLNA